MHIHEDSTLLFFTYQSPKFKVIEPDLIKASHLLTNSPLWEITDMYLQIERKHLLVVHARGECTVQVLVYDLAYFISIDLDTSNKWKLIPC